MCDLTKKFYCFVTTLLWKCFRVWSIFLPLFELLMQKYSLFGGFIGGVDADDYENDDEHSL